MSVLLLFSQHHLFESDPITSTIPGDTQDEDLAPEGPSLPCALSNIVEKPKVCVHLYTVFICLVSYLLFGVWELEQFIMLQEQEV